MGLEDKDSENEKGQSSIDLVNQGWRLLEKKDYDKAIEYYEKALAIELKADIPNVAHMWSTLGLAWRKKGEYDKAIEHYEKALACNLKNYDKEHPGDYSETALTWRDLGLVWQDKGDYDKAIEYHEKALARVSQNYDKTHCVVTRTWQDLGCVWQAKGDYDRAIECHEKSLAGRLEDLVEANRWNVAESWNNLGLAWQKKGDYDKAMDYFVRALSLLKEEDDAIHIPTLEVVEENIENLKKEMGESQS